MRPFLKWAGSKHQIVERIAAALPPGRRLVEPFVGSGAVFLRSSHPVFLLADINRDLIELFGHVQREGAAFVEFARTLFSPDANSAEVFYERRVEFNTSTDIRRKAALFVYLNRHCFNGLCRYNSRGGFNVPFGRYTAPYFPEAELLNFAERSAHAEFVHGDFIDVMRACVPGDVVYCDPPYVPLSATASFTSYSGGTFKFGDQVRLVEEAEALARRGIPVLISNHDTEQTRALYGAAAIEGFAVQRSISAKGSNRVEAPELLALFSPQPHTTRGRSVA